MSVFKFATVFSMFIFSALNVTFYRKQDFFVYKIQ